MTSENSPRLQRPLSKSSVPDNYGSRQETTIQADSRAQSDDKRQDLRGRLSKSWQDAAEKFRDDTGQDLASFQGGRDGVLDVLRKRYAGHNEDARKKDRLWIFVERALNCIEVTAGVAAQVGSMVFPPANICFAALQTLINIPQAFKKLRDDLLELCQAIASFLVTFQALERFDRRLGLDDALVEKTNDVLLALVEVCRLYLKATQHKKTAVLGSIFLKDDQVKDALQDFQRLTEELAKLTSTIILGLTMEANSTVKNTSRVVERIDDHVTGVAAKVDNIHGFQTDDRNFRASQEKMGNIYSAFGLTRATAEQPLESLKQYRRDMVDNTMDVLGTQDLYEAWSRSRERRGFLFLQGGRGSGRTYLLAALTRAILQQMEHRNEGDHKSCVAYYAFHRDNGIVGPNDWEPLRVAFECMASQLAGQSHSYASKLSKNLKNLMDPSEPEGFWRELGIDNYDAQHGTTLYLLFDGLDRLKSPLRYLKRLFNPANSPADQVTGKRHTLQLRVVFTGDRVTYDRIGLPIPELIVQQFNGPLLRKFAERIEKKLRHELGLRESDTLTKTVLENAAGSFTDLSLQFDRIRSALSGDPTLEELLAQIQSHKATSNQVEGLTTLRKTYSKIGFEHQQQLKEVLYWVVFGCRWLTVEQLEVALYLRHQQEPLTYLESKIMGIFKPSVTIRDQFVVADSSVEDYVRNSGSIPNDPSGPAKITSEGAIENANELGVRKFRSDTNNRLTVEDSDFASGPTQGSQATDRHLQFSFAEAHYTIAIRCLQTLNDDAIRPRSVPLLRYACKELPNHIYYLHSRDCYELLDADQRRALGQGMVDFLADSENLDSVWSHVAIPPEPWMYDRRNVRAIFNFLIHPSILKERAPRDRRAVKKMTQQTSKTPIPFLEDLATVAALRWLDKDKAVEGQEKECFHLVNAYLRLLDADLNLLLSRSETDSSVSGLLSGEDSTQETAATATSNSEGQAKKSKSDNGPSDKDSNVSHGKLNTTESPGKTEVESLNGQVYLGQGAIDCVVDGSASKASPRPPEGKADAVSRSADLAVGDEISTTCDMHIDGGVNDHPASGSDNALELRRITNDRVKEALDWTLKQTKLQVDCFILQRLAHTLMKEDDAANAAAIEYLKQAYEAAPPGDFGERLKIACDLAKTYDRDKSAEAFNALSPALEEFHKLREEKAFSEDEKLLLSTAFTRAATYLTAMKDDTGAINMYEDALMYSRKEAACYPELIRLLCKTDQSQRAQEIFEQWTNMAAGKKGDGPLAHLIKVARQGNIPNLSTFFFSVRRFPFRKLIIEALSDAIRDDGDAPEYLDKSALHFLRGLARAVGNNDEELRAAVQDWQACLRTHASQDDDRGFLPIDIWKWTPPYRLDLVTKSWTWAAKYHFDLYRHQLLDQPGLTITEKTKMWEELKDIVEGMQTSAGVNMELVNTPWSYVAVYARLAGLDSELRDLLRQDMVMAVRILCDDDPENDSYGIMILRGVLRCFGDQRGMHTVWSLFDRNKRAAGRNKDRAARPVDDNDDSPVNNMSQRLESNPRGGNEHQPSGLGVPKNTSIAEASTDFVCDGCDVDISSSELQEIWTCMFCPDTDFCGDCYDKLKNQKLDQVVCRHDHEHVLMQHFDYDEEDVRGQNVRIDWQFDNQDQGSHRRWKGGKVVALDEWIDMFAQDWNFTRPFKQGSE